MTVLAIDIGGTKFAAAEVTDDGVIVRRVELPIGDDPSRTLRTLVATIGTEPVGPGRLAAVGIGSAGPIDLLSGTVSPVNIASWRGFPLVDTVRELCPGTAVVLSGDAHCMALGEWWHGTLLAARGSAAGPGIEVGESLLGIVVSTGVGGGLVLAGRPYIGRTGNAALIGHVIVEPEGEPCACGARGCLETIASGPSMVRWALGNDWCPTSARPDARLLAAEARAGHPIALAAFRRGAGALAAVIVTAVALLDLRQVVIGGGVAQAGDVLFNPLTDAILKHPQPDVRRAITVLPSRLGSDAGLYGAAALALNAAG